MYHSIFIICKYLDISTELRISSSIAINHTLRNKDKVLAFCGTLAARTYVNASGGTTLYTKVPFEEVGIDLKFLRSRPFAYTQFGDPYVPNLSIIDVLMFNDREQVKGLIHANFDLVDCQ